MNRPVKHPIPGVGVVILRTGANGVEVLLVRRAKPPRENTWSIPGGKQEWGETLQDAARREVMEETGLTVEILGLVDVLDLIASPDMHYSLIDFAARPVGGTLRAGSDAADARWVPVADLGDYALWSETDRIITLAVRKFSP